MSSRSRCEWLRSTPRGGGCIVSKARAGRPGLDRPSRAGRTRRVRARRQLAVEPVESGPGRNLDTGGVLTACQDLLGPPDDESDRLRRALSRLVDRLPHRLHHRRIDLAEGRHLLRRPAVGEPDQPVTLVALAPLLDPAGRHPVPGRRQLGRLGPLALSQRVLSRVELRPSPCLTGRSRRQPVQHLQDVALPPKRLFSRCLGKLREPGCGRDLPPPLVHWVPLPITPTTVRGLSSSTGRSSATSS